MTESDLNTRLSIFNSPIRKRLTTPVLAALLTIVSGALTHPGTAWSQTDSSDAYTYNNDDPQAVYGAKSVYRIYRKDRQIGLHTVKFSETTETLTVQIASDIKVTVLKVPVFRFYYEATEVWQNGQLESVESSVTKNGSTVSHSLDTSSVPLSFASNHWHPGVLSSDTVFNTLTGKTNKVTLTREGDETIELPAGQVTATRFSYAGDITATSWYDGAGRWVKLLFKNDDGSTIEYRYDANAE